MDFLENFHTALRKGSDTSQANVLWHAIMIASKDALADFAGWCDKEWKENPDRPIFDVAADWALYIARETKVCSHKAILMGLIISCDLRTIHDVNTTVALWKEFYEKQTTGDRQTVA